jgi:uncharacterized protein DUF2784
MASTMAHATVVLHFLALLYIGFGGFLAWRWPKSIFVHIFFALWGIAVNVLPLNCPLTELENFFRNQQGLSDLPEGFNAYYIYGHLFPAELTPFIGIVALVVVTVSYVGAYVQWRHRHDDTNSGQVPIAG